MPETHVPLGVKDYKKLVFLTGAGISKASGLPTYRGEDGVWEEHKVEEFATSEAIARDPVKVWRAFRQMCQNANSVAPNAGHLAIAELESQLDAEIWVITQNVDGLHSLAGSSNVFEAHGSLRRLRCSKRECAQESWPTPEELPETPPTCPSCSALGRFDVVLFGEQLDPNFGLKVLALLGDCDLFIAVGTSGVVYPVNQLIDMASEFGARTVCVNPEEAYAGFDEFYQGKAEELLPILLA